MLLNRTYEEHQVGPELRRIYGDIRTGFDLPLVPTIFKLSAANPEYLKAMWSDLGHVARSKEFHAAASALEEYARSLVIGAGWRFGDQQKILAAQRFSLDDMEAMSLLPGLFTRMLAQVSIFSRLMQRGYGGGQKGRVSETKQAAALSRLLTVNVPNEREAGLRVWLLYSDIKRTTGTKSVTSMFRVLAPYPGYLAAFWTETKRLLSNPQFLHARDQMTKRVSSLVVGLPVKDHRSIARGVAPDVWRDIEETIDAYTRALPQFALIATVWQRSFPQFAFDETPRREKVV